MTVHVLLDRIPRRANSVFDGLRVRTAMGNDRDTVKPDEGRAPIFGIVQTAVGVSEGLPSHEITQTTREIFLKSAFQNFASERCGPFHRLERHVTGEAYADDDIDVAVNNIPSLIVPKVLKGVVVEV